MTELIKIGYIHAGTLSASSVVQKKKLNAAGCDIIFSDYSTQIDYKRTELVKAVKYAEKNENCSILVYSLEYLAASLEHLSDIIKIMGNTNIPIKSLKENIIIYPYCNSISNIGEKLLSDKNKVGYAHQFEGDPQSHSQKKLLKEIKCSKIFNGTTDSLDVDREELIKAVKYSQTIPPGCIVINSFERLAATLENMSDICHIMSKLDVSLLSISENIVIIKDDRFAALSLNQTEKELSNDRDNQKEEERKDNKVNSNALPELKLESKDIPVIPSRTERRKKKFLIKLSICLILAFVILIALYYKLRTAYDKEEMFESEYLLTMKKK